MWLQDIDSLQCKSESRDVVVSLCVNLRARCIGSLLTCAPGSLRSCQLSLLQGRQAAALQPFTFTLGCEQVTCTAM